MPAARRSDADLDKWLHKLVNQSWMIYALGDRSQPNAIVSITRGPHWADVIVLRGPDQAAAYRTLVRPQYDPLAADQVVWHYLGGAVWTISAALNIPDAANGEQPYPIPTECQVPEAAQRPMTIRPGGRTPARPGGPR